MLCAGFCKPVDAPRLFKCNTDKKCVILIPRLTKMEEDDEEVSQ